MNLSAPFIKRPIGTTLLAIGLALIGAIAFNFLPVNSLPQIDFPTIAIQAALPGASPETMAASVATPIERQLGRIAGVTEMTSSSTLGATTIVVQFDLSRDINGAARDVQAAINASASQLPKNLLNLPTYRKVNPAEAPIMVITLTSKILSKEKIYDAASTVLQQKLSQIEGVGLVFTGGSSSAAVRVELNPTVLNKYGIDLHQVGEVIGAQNVNSPKGQINNGVVTSTLVTNDQLYKAYQYKPLIIAYRNNRPVRLSDVAEVSDSVSDVRNAGLANGQPAVLVVISKAPGANVIQTIDRVRAALPFLKASISPAIDMKIAIDRTDRIRASLHDVELTLVIAMLLVIFVVYLFLGNLRAMMIPSAALALSLLGTFAVMLFFGYSLDNLSLMALTISTGFVVDDAIVVLENTSRHLETGLTPLAAAMRGAQEVSFTVVSMSLSLVAVFVPVLFMGGMIGRLFREFAVTLSAAILVSLIVSLTVTPMMCALLLRTHLLKSRLTLSANEAQHSTFDDATHVGLYAERSAPTYVDVMKTYYEKSLAWVLQRPRSMLFATLMAVILNIGLFIWIPKGFFPQQDTGRIAASIQADQDISFQALQQKLRTYVDIIHADPAVENVVGFVGFGSSTANSGSIYIALKPLAERKIAADAVISRLRKKLAVVNGATLYMQVAQDLVVGGRLGNAQFQYTLQANSLQDLSLWTPRVLQQLKTIPGIIDINSNQQNHGLQTYIKFDRDKASRFGLTTKQIDTVLYDAFGQTSVSTIYMPMNQYNVIMEVAPRYWQHPEILNDFYILSPSQKAVPFSAFATFAPATTLLSVNHQSQQPSATLSFNLHNMALGDAVNKIEQKIKDMRLPETMHGSFQGTAQAFQVSLANEPYLILAALLAVYIVLGILYESTIHPITVLSTLPSAGVGALLALLITQTELSVVALIGIILLIGIVKKNAIMMIDFALEAERRENKSSKDAIFQAAVLRFRPIMMTTVAAILGAVPLAFGYSLGSEIRRPLGIAIIGGLIVSQMLTLYSTPVIYLELEKLRGWLTSFRRPVRRPLSEIEKK